jgi:hypothetical protein
MNGFWPFRPQNLVVAWWVDRNRWLWKFYLRQAPRRMVPVITVHADFHPLNASHTEHTRPGGLSHR